MVCGEKVRHRVVVEQQKRGYGRQLESVLTQVGSLLFKLDSDRFKPVHRLLGIVHHVRERDRYGRPGQ